MTIYDISEKAGVSIATVSRVLNGSSNVSPKTKQRVLDIIEQYSYTPNVFARGLGLNSMQTVGILCADSSDLYLAKAVYLIEQLLKTYNYNSILCCTGYNLEDKQASLELLTSKKVDSIILVGSNFVSKKPAENDYIRQAAKHVPVMLLNAILDAPNVFSILCDDYRSMYQATLGMLHSGVKDIIYYYNSRTYSSSRKISGFIDAMKEYGIPGELIRTLYFEGSHEDIPGMAECLTEYSKTAEPFDGIVAADDYLALGAMKYAKQNNRKVPEDLSILGCNNSMLTSCCDPELTSIDNRLDALCSHLVETLMSTLNGKEMPQQNVFNGKLIMRGSTRNNTQ